MSEVFIESLPTAGPILVRLREYMEDHDIEEGVHWQVEGVYQLTPAAEKIKDDIRDVMWTVYG